MIRANSVPNTGTPATRKLGRKQFSMALHLPRHCVGWLCVLAIFSPPKKLHMVLLLPSNLCKPCLKCRTWMNRVRSQANQASNSTNIRRKHHLLDSWHGRISASAMFQGHSIIQSLLLGGCPLDDSVAEVLSIKGQQDLAAS